MVFFYVENAGISVTNPDDINKIIKQLHQNWFELQKEGTFSEFIGIELEEKDDWFIAYSKRCN